MEIANDLMEQLRRLPPAVVSITGLEWALPNDGRIEDALGAINLRREQLGAFPLRQIWWMPGTLVEKFVLTVPDLESWFVLRLHLTEIVTPPDRGEAGSTASKVSCITLAGQALLGKDIVASGGLAFGFEAQGSGGHSGFGVSAQEARRHSAELIERAMSALDSASEPDRIWTELVRPALDMLRAAGLEREAHELAGRFLERSVAAARATVDRLMRGGEAEHPDTVTAMNNLAYLLHEQGNMTEARHLQEQVLDSLRRSAGEEHPVTLSAMNNFAATLVAQGDLAGAQEVQQQVLASRQRSLGDGHPDTLTALNNLAVTLHKKGDLAGARRLQEQVLTAGRKTFGDEHPATLAAMNNLAGTLQEQGDLEGARRLQEQVIQTCRKMFGDYHPDTVTATSNLAGTLLAQGDVEAARQIQEQVLAAYRRLLGDDHPDALRAMNNLAGTLYAQGDLVHARELQERALAGRRNVLGDRHPDTSRTAWNLFQTLQKAGEAAEAKRVFQENLSWLLQQDATPLAGIQGQIRQIVESSGTEKALKA
jgi:hypothetical protein